MSSMFSGLFGNKDLEKQQAIARQQQSVDQARQLQTLNAETARTAVTRRNPRGRRLFADAAASALPSTVA